MKTLQVSYGPGIKTVTASGLYQYDHGVRLQISGLDTTIQPEFQFGIDGLMTTVPSIPVIEDGMVTAVIPDVVLYQSRQVRCYVYIESDTSGYTSFEIRLPIIPRPKPSDFSVAPEQVDNYNALLAAVNSAIEDLTTKVDNLTHVESADRATEAEHATSADSAVEAEHAVDADTVKGVDVVEQTEAIAETIEDMAQEIDEVNSALRKTATAILNEVSGSYVEIESITPGREAASLTSTIVSAMDTITVTRTGRNQMPFPYSTATDQKTINGITFTVAADGSVTASGTATSDASFVFRNKLKLFAGAAYTLSGCPSGGGSSTYRLRIDGGQNTWDDGNGTTFIATSDTYVSYIKVYAGATLNDVVFRPMLALENKVTPFEPYQVSVQTSNVYVGDDVLGTGYDVTYDWINGILHLPGGITRTNHPQQLDLLEGYNLVWSDSGETAISWVSNTKTYVDDKVSTCSDVLVSYVDTRFDDLTYVKNAEHADNAAYADDANTVQGIDIVKELDTQVDEITQYVDGRFDDLIYVQSSGNADEAVHAADADTVQGVDVVAAISEVKEEINDVSEVAGSKATGIVREVVGNTVEVNDAATLNAIDVISQITEVQTGEGSSSPDNIRTIAGYQTLEITRIGRNLLSFPYASSNPLETNGITFTANADGSITANGTATGRATFMLSNYSKLLKLVLGCKYTLSGCPAGGSTSTYMLAVNSANDTQGIRDVGNGVSLTTDYENYYAFIRIESGTICDNMIFRPMLNTGEQALPFEPYKASVLSATLPKEVFTGNYNWTTGRLAITRGCVVLTGQEAFAKMDSTDFNAYQFRPENYAPNSLYGKCSHYAVNTKNYKTTNNIYFGNYVTICTEHASVHEFKGYLVSQYEAGTPVTITYKLASPEVHLLESQQLEMLEGYNNIKSNSGETELTYIADTQMYVDNRFNEIQDVKHAENADFAEEAADALTVKGVDVIQELSSLSSEILSARDYTDSKVKQAQSDSVEYTDSIRTRLSAMDNLLLASTQHQEYEIVYPSKLVTYSHSTSWRLYIKDFPILPGRFSVTNANSDMYEFSIRYGDAGTLWYKDTWSIDLAGKPSVQIWVQKPDRTDLTDADIEAINSGLTFTYTVGGAYAVQKTKECGYVSPTGSDENDGTEAAPYATVSKAIADGCRNILLYGGVYEQTITLPEFGVVRIAAVERTSVPVFIDPNRMKITSASLYAEGVYVADASFSVLNDTPMIFQDGVADATTLITDAERMPQQRGKVYRCDDTPLRKCTATELADAVTEMQSAEDYRFFYDADNGKLYFTAPDADFAAHPITCSSNGVLFKGISRAITLHVAGIECKYMRFDISRTVNSVIADCKASCAYASALGQFMYDDAINPRFINCEACLSHGKNNGDGFNSHCSNSGDPYAHQSGAVLENCWSHDNMDDGWSDHHRSETMIFGGLYEYNGKGGVTPSYGTHLTCRDVYSRHNYNGFYYVADGSEDGGMYGQMICYNCVAEENTRGTGQRHAGFALSGENNSMILVNCKTINNAVGYVCAVASNMAKLIDCGSIGDDKPVGATGTYEIVNTDRLGNN